MGLTVFSRHAYDDVALLASTDDDANAWRLEVEGGEGGEGWDPIDAAIWCSNLNWSTLDLTNWGELRLGEPNAIRQAFPGASRVVPLGEPLAVMWDVSNYYRWENPRSGRGYLFRFTDPLGKTFEFGCDVISGNDRYTFGSD